MKKKAVFEVCVICGRVAEQASEKKDFNCVNCGSNICIVLSRKLFGELAKKLGEKK